MISSRNLVSPKFFFMLACCVALSAMPQSQAQAGSKDDAVKYYKEGRAHLEKQEYDQAIAKFSLANTLDPNPVLVYNIARANELKGAHETALIWYRQYMSMGISEADKKDANERIAAIEAKMSAAKEEAEPVEMAKVAPEEPEEVEDTSKMDGADLTAPDFGDSPPPAEEGLSTTTWILIGVGGAALLTGIIILAASGGEESSEVGSPGGEGEEYDDEEWARPMPHAYRVRPAMTPTSIGPGSGGDMLAPGLMMGLGAAALTTGLILQFTGTDQPTEGVQLSPWAGPQGGGLNIGGQF